MTNAKTSSRINSYQHKNMFRKQNLMKIVWSKINIKISNNNIIIQNGLLKYWEVHKWRPLSTFLALWIFTGFFCSRFWEKLHSLHHCLVLLRLLPVAVYVVLVTFLRYHLFMWTVFSPKLLYEAVHTSVISLLVLLTNFLAKAVVKEV
jgi:hypothetical protein